MPKFDYSWVKKDKKRKSGRGKENDGGEIEVLVDGEGGEAKRMRLDELVARQEMRLSKTAGDAIVKDEVSDEADGGVPIKAET